MKWFVGLIKCTFWLSCVLAMQSMEVRVQYLLQEGSMLLPPTDTPLTGIEFTRRLPCGETERARKVGSL